MPGGGKDRSFFLEFWMGKGYNCAGLKIKQKEEYGR